MQDLTYNVPLSVIPEPESICDEDECELDWVDEEESDKEFIVDFEEEEIEDNDEF